MVKYSLHTKDTYAIAHSNIFWTRSKKLTKNEYVGSYDDVCFRFKGMLLSKALTCMQFFMYNKMAMLSRIQIPLAILMYEQFIHLTQITLRPNIQLLSTLQHV